MKKIPVFVFAFLMLGFSLASNAAATTIFSSNSSGTEQNLFYANETVYVYADNNVTNNNTIVRIYIVKDGGAPSDGSELSGLFGYRVANTNASGHIGIELASSSGAAEGDYDIIIDVGNDGRFNSSKDHIDSGSAKGFTVKAIPAPSIAFSIAGNTSSSHTTKYGDNNSSVMMQMKIETGSEEAVTITSLDVRGFGTGNDRDGVSLVSVYTDADADGKIGLDDRLIGLEKFATDDGIINIGMGHLVPSNTIKYFLITYKMSNKTSDGQTYYFEVTSAKLSVASGRKITSSGFVLKSATKTMSGSSPAIVCSSYTENVTCSSQSVCSWCGVDNKCKNSGESCSAPTCSGTPSLDFSQSDVSVTANITGLSNCDGKITYLKEANCEGAAVNSCTVAGGGCALSFAKPSTNKSYSVCIDKNTNGIFESTEQYSKLLAISPSKGNRDEGLKNIISILQENWIYVLVGVIVLVVSAVFLYFLLTPEKTGSQVQTTTPEPSR